MLIPAPVLEREVTAVPAAIADAAAPARSARVPAIARFLPSLTDVAFLMPLLFLFLKLDGARTLLGDGDTGWHLRTGEWILNNHQVPYTDMFSFSRPGAQWFAWEWLWDLMFAVFFKGGGLAANVLREFSLSLRRNSYRVPCKTFVPDLVTRLITPPSVYPYSADMIPLCTLNS